MNNETESFLPFTEEELEQLNFTPEELEILESASAYAKTESLLPEDMDGFIQKIDESFDDSANPDVTFQKLADLCTTDPDFVSQLLAFQEVYSAVKVYDDEEVSENRK